MVVLSIIEPSVIFSSSIIDADVVAAGELVVPPSSPHAARVSAAAIAKVVSPIALRFMSGSFKWLVGGSSTVMCRRRSVVLNGS